MLHTKNQKANVQPWRFASIFPPSTMQQAIWIIIVVSYKISHEYLIPSSLQVMTTLQSSCLSGMTLGSCLVAILFSSKPFWWFTPWKFTFKNIILCNVGKLYVVSSNGYKIFYICLVFIRLKKEWKSFK